MLEVPDTLQRVQRIPTGTGHELAVCDDVIVARNSKGKELASVPPAARKTSAWEDLDAVLSSLHTHDVEAGAEVECWLLRSLLVPWMVLVEVQTDEAWCFRFTDPAAAFDDGKVAGFLHVADSCGLGVADLDGESATITAERVLFPHLALLADLDDLREFAVKPGTKQRFDQLLCEVHRRPDGIALEAVELTQYVGGEFEQLHFAAGHVSPAGFKVSGDYATCLCLEDGEPIMARYRIGVESPECETVTGDLHWVRNDRIVPVAEVGPLAYSEGVRIAAYILAGRKVKADKDER